MEPQTVPAVFIKTVDRFEDRVALREKEYGLWREITWKEFGRSLRWACLGMVALGLEKGQRVSIISENNPEWFIADLGVQSAGGITVGIYTTNSPFELKYIVEHSESRILHVQDEEQLDKVLEVREELPCLEWIVVFDMEGLRKFRHYPVISEFSQSFHVKDNNPFQTG